MALHNIGKMAIGVSNNSSIGTQYSSSGSQDCFTGELVPNCAYPKGTETWYLYGAAFWIGAVVGRDTLVSVGQDGWHSAVDFHPDDAPLGNMKYRSTIDPSKPEFEDAVSEQDYIAVYTDTFTSGVSGLSIDWLDHRPHIPLHIEVTQRSYAWSYSYAEDFVLFDYALKNIGTQRLKQVYMGVYVDADVHHDMLQANGAQDDICGFLHKARAFYAPYPCSEHDSDIVNLAWISDNDGDFNTLPGCEVPHVTGTRIVRTPNPDSLKVSFNWWIGNQDPTLDFGPQTKKKYRNYGTGGTGTPMGDRNKYFVLSNGEFDYNQIFTASIPPLDTLWLPHPNKRVALELSKGYDTRYLLSFGPFDIESGQVLPISFAYVAGEDLHNDPYNHQNYLEDDYNPTKYYDGLDFNDLSKNAIWAEWIYDNPGIDTDSDGFAGVFDTCNLGGDSSIGRINTLVDTFAGVPVTVICTTWAYENDSIYAIKGDGVPDFRGANPPPAPKLWAIPRLGAITIRWNGTRSETSPDNFSQALDFEGYRVYMGRDERLSSYSLVQSYDFENFNKWVFDDTTGVFILRERPYTLQELRCWYAPDSCNDTLWDPLDYPRSKPFPFGDSVFYFVAQDYNRSVLANYGDSATTGIRKCYINAMKPTMEWVDNTATIPDTLRDSLLTEDGYFKYYEYEYTIGDLLPTVPYWINVTAFDYGSPSSGLPSLETSPTIMPAVTYALESIDSVETKDLKIFIYPNPYRLDAGYRAAGFEGYAQDDRGRPDDRVRRIHFANLPPKCTIRIFSIDGDLVRELEHDVHPSDPLANHETWDMITRNTQLVVSGLYYWVVEIPGAETQIGKLVVIM